MVTILWQLGVPVFANILKLNKMKTVRLFMVLLGAHTANVVPLLK
jgi:hypothetical protein